MAGAIKLSATSRANAASLVADPDLTGTVGTASTNWLAEIGMRVSAAEGNGGLRFNVRLPAGATGLVFKPWSYSHRGGCMSPVLSLHEDGIGLNVGASAADYFTLDFFGAAFDGVIHGVIAFRIAATTGAVTVEWGQARSSAVPTVLGVGSGFAARNP